MWNEEVISSYDRAVEINADFYEAWTNRGVELYNRNSTMPKS